MPWHHDDYYGLLGVPRGVSAQDLDHAYRRAARATHPDVHPDDASAAERFHAVTVAYETLSDPRRRASYDKNHPGASSGASVRVAHRREPAAIAPVHLGRRPRAEPLRSFPDGSTVEPTDDLVELFQALTRFVEMWPFHRGV